jgi:hypothetical protein
MDRYTFRGEEPTCHTSQARSHHQAWPAVQVRPAWQVRPHRPVPCLRSKSSPSPRAQLGWTRLIKETSAWSNGWSWDHLDQWVHLFSRSTATTIIPRPSWVSLSKGGSSHGLEVRRPHLPTAMLTKADSSYQPSIASGVRIRSVQVKRRWIIGPAAPPHPATPMKMGPHAQPTSLTYKRSLTPAGLNTLR